MRRHISTLPPGTSAYSNDKCRCDDCRAAQAANQAALREWYESHRDQHPVPHGTVNGYNNYRCRCDDCRRANTSAARDYMRRRREAAS